MSRPIQIINHTAETEISQYEIVAFGSKRGCVVRGTGLNPAFGVCCQPGTSAAGHRVDVVEAGIAEVRFGGAVDAGDPITSDANGLAIKAVFGNAIIGIARHAAVAGEIGEVGLAFQASSTIGGQVAALQALVEGSDGRIAALEHDVNHATEGLVAKVSAQETIVGDLVGRVAALENT